MKGKLAMKDNSLDMHLKMYCDANKEYQNLYSTWSLNKKTCTEALKTVLIRYPHFSMHDSSHAEAILSKIEMLLGDRINTLSPTDTWLILNAAYAHDLGMIVKWEEIQKLWNCSEFQEYLKTLKSSEDTDLREAAVLIEKDDCEGPIWLLKAYRVVTLVNAAYFRNRHADMSRNYIDHITSEELNIDLGHSGLIQGRLLHLLGLICATHTKDAFDVLKLDLETNGFGSDYAHPRFVAMMLRLGDLLDIDNGRFNPTAELVNGWLPKTSVPHKKKHESTTHLLVKPEKIEFSSDCPDEDAYLETRNFVAWLETEVDFLTKYWVKIVPSNLGGFAPRFDTKRLMINGAPDIDGVAGLRFEISQKRAFEIIEGSNIYEDKFVFIREVIQNALDATKVQLWRDLCSGTYQAWMEGMSTNLEQLQPYDIGEAIYKNYPINIELRTLDNDSTEIVITDRGTGITVNDFKRMCNVGSSIGGSQILKEEVHNMPSWLRPTAGFGIGLQSVFLVTDKFSIETSDGIETLRATVHSNRLGGYMQLQKTNCAIPRGTRITIVMHQPKTLSYSVGGDTDMYLYSRFDPMEGENHLGEVRILETLKTNCANTWFPIRVKCQERSITDIELVTHIPIYGKMEKESNWSTDGIRYWYRLVNDYTTIEIWDRKYAAYGTLALTETRMTGARILFKGMRVEKNIPFNVAMCMNVQVDVYGLDTRECIALSRNKMTSKGREHLYEIMEGMQNLYASCVLKVLKDNSISKTLNFKRFNMYNFWLACKANQRMEIPKNLLKEHLNQEIGIIQGKNGVFEVCKCKLFDVIPLKANIRFMNLDRYRSYHGSSPYDTDAIVKNLKPEKDAGVEDTDVVIVLDESLNRAAKEMPTERLEKIGNVMLLKKTDKECCVDAGNEVRAIILRGLGAKILGLRDSYWESSDVSRRYGIPALSGYENLRVEWIPRAIARPHIGAAYSIIAPFNREQNATRHDKSKNAFREDIMQSLEFKNTVDYVLENSPEKGNLSRDVVEEAYGRLIDEYYTVMEESTDKARLHTDE